MTPTAAVIGQFARDLVLTVGGDAGPLTASLLRGPAGGRTSLTVDRHV